MATRYDMLTARPKQDGGTWWHKIGTAFEAKEGAGFNCYLDSLPLPDKDGKVSFIIREAKDLREASGTGERRARLPQSTSAVKSPLDDEIPF